MRALTFLANRFVAGDTAADAIAAVKRLEDQGIHTTLDFLGEETATEAQAAAAAQEYLSLLQAIRAAGLKRCNVSLKLTQFGLNLDPKMAADHLLRVLEEADKSDNFVRLDMEGSPYTQSTLDLFHKVFQERKNVGAVIQAYLKRSRRDIEELNRVGARVRLCKGAYKESSKIAFSEKAKVNASYDELTQLLLEQGNYPGLATHDEDRIQAALEFAKDKGIAKDKFELQMLYGLRRKRWTELVAAGYNVRVYVPYGTHWLPYFTRRIRERKENWLFVLKNLVHG
jgi:proline dehydrogenase